MRLKDGFVTCQNGDTQLMVAAGKQAQVFSGMCKSNTTAAFIIDQLKTDTTIDEITDKLFEKYDAPRDTIKNDVESIIAKLESIDALEL